MSGAATSVSVPALVLMSKATLESGASTELEAGNRSKKLDGDRTD